MPFHKMFDAKPSPSINCFTFAWSNSRGGGRGRRHAADALGLEVLVRDTLKATSSKTKPLLFGILHGGLAESSG